MHRSLVALAAVAIALVAAAPADADSGKRKGKGSHTPPTDDRFFVADPSDARRLYPSDKFIERGFDRDYVEAMARPRIPREVLDGIEAQIPRRSIKLEPGTPNPFAAVVQQGNVVVIEGNNTFVVNSNQGLGFNHNDGLFTAAQTVLNQLGDNFDFITIWTTFPDAQVAAYYLPLKQDVEGLGECNFNAGNTFGCLFDQTGLRLQGLVFMNSISTWQQWDRDFDGRQFPLDDFNSSLYSTLGQEIAHRWGAGLRFVDPRTGNVSKKLLGRDESHWAAFVDTDASVMDGWDWEDRGGGAFELVDVMDTFNTLDLYAMGALPVAAAEPFFFIDGAQYTGGAGIGATGAIGAQDALFFPGIELMEEFGIDLGATGTRVDVTIQDVVDAEGNRCPDPDNTQKTFRQAIVLVTRPGETAAQASQEASDLELVHETWEAWWLDRTRKALTLCTDVAGDCKQAAAALAGGALDTPDGDRIEPGDDITLHVEVEASGDRVKNARLFIELKGAGAGDTSLEESEIVVGDVAEGSSIDVPVALSIRETAACGSPLQVSARLVSDNAPDVVEEYRLFIGRDLVFGESFGKADEFSAEGDGAGAFERVDVALSCDITERTPERDASPGDAGAYVTGNAGELSGQSSLTSPEINLKGSVNPQLRFAYWLDGVGELSVSLSDDGGRTFERGATESEPAHEWQNGFVDITETFGGKVPENIVVKFVFEGTNLEGGIDDVRVLSAAGQCGGGGFGFPCGCSTEGDAAPQSALAIALAALGLRSLRSLRRRSVPTLRQRER